MTTLPPTFTTGFPPPRPKMTAATIGAMEFSSVRKDGLDRDEVMSFLGSVADHVAELEGRVQELESELEQQRRQTPSHETGHSEAYEQATTRIAGLLRTFDQDVQRMRAEAEAEADRMLEEARTQAQRLQAEAGERRQRAETEAARVVTAATEEADRVREDARREADELIGSLGERRDGLVQSIRRMREGLAKTAESLDAMLERAEGGGDVVVLHAAPERRPDGAQ